MNYGAPVCLSLSVYRLPLGLASFLGTRVNLKWIRLTGGPGFIAIAMAAYYEVDRISCPESSGLDYIESLFSNRRFCLPGI